MPEVSVFEAAIDLAAATDVTMAAAMLTFDAPFAAVAEVSSADVAADRPASETALPLPPSQVTRSHSPLRVQRLARLDAFESFDNLLLLADSANELAVSQASAARSTADEVLGSGDTESSEEDSLGASLATPWNDRPQLESAF
jgi:hypothetical protein